MTNKQALMLRPWMRQPCFGLLLAMLGGCASDPASQSSAAAGVGGAVSTVPTPSGVAGTGGTAQGGSVGGGPELGSAAGGGTGGVSGSGAAGAPIQPTAGDPPSREGVVVWLDAERGVTQSAEHVSTWVDQSDSHNDFHQAAHDNQPLFVQSGIAGHPLLRFDRKLKTVLIADDAESLHFGRGGFTVVLAAADRNPIDGGHGASVGTLFGKPQLGDANAEITFAFNWFTTETTPDEPALHIGIGEGRAGPISNFRQYNDGKFRIFTGAWRADGASLDMSIFVNGKLDGHEREASAPDLSLPGQPLRLGETYGQATTADIAELVVIKGTPAVAQVSAWEAYLMAKYGLPPNSSMP